MKLLLGKALLCGYLNADEKKTPVPILNILTIVFIYFHSTIYRVFFVLFED